MVTTGVMPTEIWDPVSQTWSAAAPISAARNYHSTAVLMPDGTVLSAGGGHFNGLNDAAEENYQIYSPSYLFNGPRPTITSAPSSATYGSTISVATPDASSITAVNLVSLGTDTHQIDMNQHFVPLSFTAGNGSLNVTMPSSAADAPPGHYMLFILNKSGTPSIASMIGLNQSTTPVAPGAPTGVTATAGNGSANVSWTAPNDGNSPITSYTITPSAGGTTLTPTVISGNPAATSATITGLTNGTSYTFTVTATNAVGTGPASAPSNAVTPTAPTAPGTPTGVTATAGNGSANVSWTAPSNGGSAITSYTVTPYLSGVAQTPTTVTGTPPSTTATVTGLTNGQSYTFTVTATNAVGSGPASSASNAVTPSAIPAPAFVQQASTHAASGSSISVTPSTPLGTGNRLVVEVGVWSGSGAKTSSVTDTAGDTFTEVSHFTGPDQTEQSVWTAPITAGAGNTPTVTAKFSCVRRRGDHGAGVQRAVDRGRLGRGRHRRPALRGRRRTAGSVSSGPTAATGAGNELAVGFYSDSGFGDSLTAGSGYTARTNISNDGRHGAPGRGPGRRSRCHARGERRNGRQDDLGDGHRGVQGGQPGSAHRAGRAGQRHGHRGRQVRHRVLDGARQRRQPDHLLHRHALCRDHRSDTDRHHRHPADDQRQHHRPDRRHRLHLHGQRHERRRYRARVGGVQPGHADRPHRAGGAGERDRDRGESVRHGELDCAGQRRQPDHHVHGHSVPGGSRADADPGGRKPARDDSHRHRPYQRKLVHLYGLG